MSEECIHANVYVPLQHLPAAGEGAAPRNRTLLPVLVQIHGGGFGFGSGDPDLQGPEYLMKHDVVVVTFNYRLLHFILMGVEIQFTSQIKIVVFVRFLEFFKQSVKRKP